MENSESLNLVIMAALSEAKNRGHEYLTAEHMLYAILFSPEGIEIIENCGGDIEALKKNLSHHFDERIPKIRNPKMYVTLK